MPSPAVYWNWVQTRIFIQWNGFSYFITLNERSFRLTRKNKQPSQEEDCVLHLFTDWSTKKKTQQNQMMITADRWYLGKWKPARAGSDHLRDTHQCSLLPGHGGVCLPCLSFLEGNNWENLYTHKDKISRKQAKSSNSLWSHTMW